MGLDKVVGDILRRGEERSRDIVRTGEKERDEIIAAAQRKIEADRGKAGERTKAAIAQMEQQELSSAELESKREVLEAEKLAMDELREQVLQELGEYPQDKRARLYAKLVVKAKAELGPCSVFSNRSDSGLLKLPAGVTSGGTIECRGGLVFESKDGAVRLDYRFESIIDEVWNAKMREIYGKLFG